MDYQHQPEPTPEIQKISERIPELLLPADQLAASGALGQPRLGSKEQTNLGS